MGKTNKQIDAFDFNKAIKCGYEVDVKREGDLYVIYADGKKVGENDALTTKVNNLGGGFYACIGEQMTSIYLYDVLLFNMSTADFELKFAQYSQTNPISVAELVKAMKETHTLDQKFKDRCLAFAKYKDAYHKALMANVYKNLAGLQNVVLQMREIDQKAKENEKFTVKFGDTTRTFKTNIYHCIKENVVAPILARKFNTSIDNVEHFDSDRYMIRGRDINVITKIANALCNIKMCEDEALLNEYSMLNPVGKKATCKYVEEFYANENGEVYPLQEKFSLDAVISSAQIELHNKYFNAVQRAEDLYDEYIDLCTSFDILTKETIDSLYRLTRFEIANNLNLKSKKLDSYDLYEANAKAVETIATIDDIKKEHKTSTDFNALLAWLYESKLEDSLTLSSIKEFMLICENVKKNVFLLREREAERDARFVNRLYKKLVKDYDVSAQKDTAEYMQKAYQEVKDSFDVDDLDIK